MTTNTETQPKRERSLLYIITAVVLVVVGVIAVVMFMSARSSVQAEDKAEELIQNLEDAGVDVHSRPSRSQGSSAKTGSRLRQPERRPEPGDPSSIARERRRRPRDAADHHR